MIDEQGPNLGRMDLNKVVGAARLHGGRVAAVTTARAFSEEAASAAGPKFAAPSFAFADSRCCAAGCEGAGMCARLWCSSNGGRGGRGAAPATGRAAWGAVGSSSGFSAAVGRGSGFSAAAARSTPGRFRAARRLRGCGVNGRVDALLIRRPPVDKKVDGTAKVCREDGDLVIDGRGRTLWHEKCHSCDRIVPLKM